MKIKYLFIVVWIAISNKSSFAQLKINQYGRLGMGIDPHPSDKLLIKGNLTLTTYPEIPPSVDRFTELRFKVGNGYPGAEIGTPTRKIAIWSSEVGYNNLYAAHFYTSSDISIKTEIEPLTNALEKVLQLNSYSYKLKYDSLIDEKTTFGFLAQEIHSLLPDITDTAKGIMLIDYQQIIPLLAEALKEQQEIIDSLKNSHQQMRIAKSVTNYELNLDSLFSEINELKKQISVCCNQRLSQLSATSFNSKSRSILFQNIPNPFSEKTVIRFEINENFRNASIMIFDMQGTLKIIIPISQNGKGQIIINGFELSAGIYLYSLIIDNKEIDNKRMILLN